MKPGKRNGTEENKLTAKKSLVSLRERNALQGKTSGRDISTKILQDIITVLEDGKAEDIVSIDLKDISPMGDFMVIATGRSNRHVGAVADQLLRKLKDLGQGNARTEGMPQCDWVLIDTGDVIVHLFRPEVRDFYNLEKMWSSDRPNSLETV